MRARGTPLRSRSFALARPSRTTGVCTVRGVIPTNRRDLPLSCGSEPMFGLDVTHLLETYGYGAVGLLIFLEDFGIPSPGETVLIAGAIASSQGDLNVFLVAAVGFVAAVMGDNVGYLIGRYGGRPLVLGLGRRIHIGRHHLVTPKRFDHAQSFFHRFGSWIIVVARFIEGLRQLNGIVAGTLHYRWGRFVALNAMGAALWVGFWTSVAYYAGNWATQSHGVFQWFLIGGVIVLIVSSVIGIYLWKRSGRAHSESSGH